MSFKPFGELADKIFQALWILSGLSVIREESGELKSSEI
jgi:hypothetical protein